MKKLTITEFARMGGKARAQKLSKEQLSAIGRTGGRPRLGESPLTTGSSLKSRTSLHRHKPASKLKLLGDGR